MNIIQRLLHFSSLLLVKRRVFFALAFATVFMLTVALTQQAPAQQAPAQQAPTQQTPSAATRLSDLGSENSQMAQRAGFWDVTETVWDSPEATPTTSKLVAERKMIGSFLQEIIEPAPNSAASDIKRIDYLSFNRVEGRWKYVSMDTRAPVGLMPAASYDRGENERITLTFEPFAIAGSGTNVTGQLLRMEQIIIQQDADHDQKDQYFVLADGTGEKLLAHRYAYARRRSS